MNRMKIKKLFMGCLAALVVLFGSIQVQAQEAETIVQIDTDKGKIKVKLYNDTPKHRDNFIKNVNDHLYDGLLFHRVIKQFMIQAGDINSKDAPIEQHLGDGDLGYTIPCECDKNIHKHLQGTMSMAHRGKDTGCCQFFICHAPQPHLDGVHTVFGQVTDNIEAVLAMRGGDVMKKVVIEE